MFTGNVSGYRPRPVEYNREPEPKQVEKSQQEPSQPSAENLRAEKAAEARELEKQQYERQPTPEDLRAERVASQPPRMQQILGGNIDVYA
jgi:hypothetical protein